MSPVQLQTQTEKGDAARQKGKSASREQKVCQKKGGRLRWRLVVRGVSLCSKHQWDFHRGSPAEQAGKPCCDFVCGGISPLISRILKAFPPL